MKNFNILLLFSHVSDIFNACAEIFFPHLLFFFTTVPSEMMDTGFPVYEQGEKKSEEGAINQLCKQNSGHSTVRVMKAHGILPLHLPAVWDL
jgi:hypothetical protein